MAHSLATSAVDKLVSKYQQGLVMVSGPSASGKTEVINALTSRFGEFQRPRSYTTRCPREGENGSEYEFIDDETFNAMRARGEFLNCDFVYGHWYAMTNSSVAEILDREKFVVKEIHPDNHAIIDRNGLPTIKVLLLPADRSEWRTRLTQRNPDRVEADDRYFEQLHWPDYDIVRYVWPNERPLEIAETLRRAVLSHAHFGHYFPRPGDIDRMNQAGYDDVAADFSDAKRVTTSNFHSISRAFFEAEIAAIPEGSRCLEIGPGNGWLRNSVAWPCVDYASLDLSSAMRANVDAKAGSARAIPWPTAHFNCVVASLADPFLFPTALAEINRVLRPSGRFIFSTPTRHWSDGLRTEGDRQKTAFVIQGNRAVKVYSFTFYIDELTSMAEVAGFRALRVHEVKGAEITPPISPAITEAARTNNVSVRDLRILHTVVMERVQ